MNKNKLWILSKPREIWNIINITTINCVKTGDHERKAPALVSIVTRRICVVLSCAARGQHAPGSVLPGWAREGHRLLFRLRLRVDLVFWRSFDGWKSFRSRCVLNTPCAPVAVLMVLDVWFSLFEFVYSCFFDHSLPLGNCFKPGFSWLCG